MSLCSSPPGNFEHPETRLTTCHFPNATHPENSASSYAFWNSPRYLCPEGPTDCETFPESNN
eukprot:1144700-Pelagomonas_calceolata.AAC.2